MRRLRSQDGGFGVVADPQLARAQTWVQRPTLKEPLSNVTSVEGRLLLTPTGLQEDTSCSTRHLRAQEDSSCA